MVVCNNLEICLGQRLSSLYEAEFQGEELSQTLCCIEGQYLAEMNEKWELDGHTPFSSQT